MEKESIASWLRERLSQTLELPIKDIDDKTAFFDYGLDSAAGIVLLMELNEFFDITLDPGMLWDYPTISALSEYIAQILKDRRKT